MNDWLTLLAIVLGPTVGVLITLFIERIRRTHDRRLHITRMLLATRHIPADAQWSAAVNLIPAEFNDQAEVMRAWRAYHAIVRERPTQELRADHERRMNAAQSTMIFQVLRTVGLKLSEGDVQTEAYVSQGLVERDMIYMDSLRALPEIAATMKEQAETTKALLALAQRRPPVDVDHRIDATGGGN